MTTTLYRAYDSVGRLLYVGITEQAVTERLKKHRNNPGYGKWNVGWPYDMATFRVEHYPDRKAALAAESVAIRDEDPVFNCAGRPRERMVKWMLAYPNRHADDITPGDIEEHERALDRELERERNRFYRAKGWADG